MMQQEIFLSTAEVAQRLGCDPSTVIRYIEDGDLPGSFKMNPKKKNSPYKVPKSAVERYLQMRQSTSA